MQAYEFSTTITADGKLELPSHLKNLTHQPRVRVILLVEDALVEELPDAQTESLTENASDDATGDTSIEAIAASLRRALHDVETGRTKPIAQLWDSMDES